MYVLFFQLLVLLLFFCITDLLTAYLNPQVHLHHLLLQVIGTAKGIGSLMFSAYTEENHYSISDYVWYTQLFPYKCECAK